MRTITLNGVSVPRVWLASGADGFFGEGYWYHPVQKALLGKRVHTNGAVFTAKTTTIDPRAGNMPLLKDKITPRDLMPRCIYIDPVRNFALNAVGLSGPGAEFLFKKNLWQQRREFFFLSFMAVGQTREERMTEFKRFLELLTFFLPGFQTAIGLQINISCPNVGMKMQTLEIVEEVKEMLSLLLPFKIVVVLKTDPLFDPDAAAMISRHPGCHAITPSNTIAFDKLSGSDQKWLFESGRSPLRRFKGGGGLSGDPLRRYAVDATRKFFMAGIRKPIIGGGGITDLYHVSEFYMSGAAGVQLGSVRFLRPYRVAKIIGFADRWA